MPNKEVDLLLKAIVIQNPQVLLDAISERVNALQQTNESYPRYAGTLYGASKEVEDNIENLLDEIDAGIVMLKEPEIWAMFDNESQTALNEWIEMTKVGLQANRTEVKKAREFLAKYGQ